jgi:pentatricopeptide repeat protein
MEERNLEHNVVLYSTIIDEVFDVMIQKGIKPGTIMYNSLIDSYCLQNRMDEAVKVFNTMVQNGCSPSIVSYIILIHGYCKKKKKELMRQ